MLTCYTRAGVKSNGGGGVLLAKNRQPTQKPKLDSNFQLNKSKFMTEIARKASLVIVSVMFAACSDSVSLSHFSERDAYLCSAINRVGARASEAKDENENLKRKVRDLEDRVDKLERQLRR
jgi:septal ring factor EnvC (AmiA/AmiB activator)